MTIEQILEILENYKLRIPPTVFYDLKADIVNFEEPTTKNDLRVDREDAVERLNALKQLIGYDKDSEIVKATQKSLDMAIKALDQEPMVEIDLYSVIKQKYIEREVLDKIRAEIIELRSRQNVGVLECLDIIDKYKAESEKTDG